jgi:DNA-binding NarL/FixJ family response regulator
MLSVLVVDDHFVARHGLKQALREEFRDIAFGEAATAAEALIEIAKQRWAVIILDISIPATSGFQVLEEIRKKSSTARVLVLSVHSEPQYAARAFRLGALAYVTKDAGRAEILAAFRSVLAGRKYVSASLARRLKAQSEAAYDVGPEVLSSRERTVLLALAAGKRVTEIAKELNLDARTVTTYRRRILNKLHLHTVADIVRYVMDHQIS